MADNKLPTTPEEWAKDIQFIRDLIGDIVQPYKITDEHIKQLISLTNGDLLRAGSLAAQSIGAQFTEFSDIEIAGAVKVEMGTTHKNYMSLAENLAGGGHGQPGAALVIPWDVPIVGVVATGLREPNEKALFKVGMMDTENGNI